jgi:hypothetical protein
MAIILVKNNHQPGGYTLSMKTKRQGFLLSPEKALRAVVELSESTLRITVQPLSDDLRVRRLLCGKAAFREGRTPLPPRRLEHDGFPLIWTADLPLGHRV